MCKLTCHLAARCRHPIRYEYDHCAKAPYPERCPKLVDSVDASMLDDNKPLCNHCFKRTEDEITAEFRRERLRITSKARAENRSLDEISEVRRQLMIEHYKRLKYAYKPLPAIPTADTEVSSLGKSSESSTELDEDDIRDIRESLKNWTYKKLDYLWKPLPVSGPPSCFDESKAGWLERDDSGVQLRYVRAPSYGEYK